jgi:CRP-like cAMP-binding protein
VIEKAMRKDLERRIGFLKEIRIFSHKSGAYLQRLLLFFTPIKIDFGKVLYKVGE